MDPHQANAMTTLSLFAHARALTAALACFGAAAIVTASGSTAHASPPASKKDSKAMTTSKPCPKGNLERSQCMIRLLLDDVAKTYDGSGGGGISAIRALNTTTYAVSLPQEGRIDVLTYEFELHPDGRVAIKSRTPSTQNVGPGTGK